MILLFGLTFDLFLHYSRKTMQFAILKFFKIWIVGFFKINA